ncbi:hypothetical protein FCULG_00002300 [Fusarium culmorum]|uniref:Uncharacterized protein n=1 Tax=Fusarium culmorum TaxID=5516 RepID=A0A2T4GL35_FUSCU|nr:hypothetical protein FCULG_00002300 [Fusarium culmorum]
MSKRGNQHLPNVARSAMTMASDIYAISSPTVMTRAVTTCYWSTDMQEPLAASLSPVDDSTEKLDSNRVATNLYSLFLQNLESFLDTSELEGSGDFNFNPRIYSRQKPPNTGAAIQEGIGPPPKEY